MPFAPVEHPIFKLKEPHRSGPTPDKWVCAWCGKKLKGEPHYLGISTGYRYCNRCMERGRKGEREFDPLSDGYLLGHSNIPGPEPRRVV